MSNDNPDEDQPLPEQLAVCGINVYLVRGALDGEDAFRVEIDTSGRILEKQPKLFFAALAMVERAVRERLSEAFNAPGNDRVH